MAGGLEYEKKLSVVRRDEVLSQVNLDEVKVFAHFRVHDHDTVENLTIHKNGEVEIELESQQLSERDTVTLSFISQSQKYLLKATLASVNGKKCVLSSESSLYLVQRRDNFRVNIMGPTWVNLQLSELANSPSQVQAKVINLSLGGCLVEIEGSSMNARPGDLLKGEIVATGFKSIAFEGIIRRHQKKQIGHVIVEMYGVEFVGLAGHRLGFLNEIVMKCSREASRAYS